MAKKEEAPPISWFPSAADRKNWADQFAQMQQLKLKEQQAAHARWMAEQAHVLKKEQLKAAKKSANSKKKK
jgi:hypothetical protein